MYALAPPGRGRQVGLQPGGRGAGRLVGQRDLGGAPEHVALPLGAGVVVMRERGDDLPDVGGLGHRVDAAGQREQVLCLRGVIISGGQLRAEGEVGGEPARQVWADRLAGRRRLEHRPVLDVVRRRVIAGTHIQAVLLLRQEPEVVVALDRVARVAVADADLDVHHLLRRIPQLADPLQAELGLRQQRRVLARVVPRRDEHQRVGVAGRVRELLVAAPGVEPAAGHVHRPADPMQRAQQVVVVVVARGRVDVGPLIGQVGGLAVQHRRAGVRPVALGGEVPYRVVHELAVQLRPAADHERRGYCRGRGQDPDLVDARRTHPGEAELVHRAVGGIPRPHVIGGRAAVGDAVRGDDLEAHRGHRPGQHREGDLRAGRGVPHLVDADFGRSFVSSGCYSGRN